MQEENRLSKKIGYPLLCVIGFFFVFFWKTEKNLADWGNILWTTEYVLRTLAVSVLLGCALGCLTAFLLYGGAGWLWHRICNVMPKASHEGSGKRLDRLFRKLEKLSNRQVFLGSFALILLAWLPVYLAYYPGICAYDSLVQIGSIVEGYYIDHHPIAHTLLIKGMLWLGSTLFGDVNTGIAIYAVLQMGILAAAMAYGLLALHRHRVKAGWQIAVLFFCMCYPFHWFMSVSVTKDTIFGAFLLLQIVALTEILLEEAQGPRIKGPYILLFVSTVGMILFRNNGKYAMAVLLFFLVLAWWRGRRCRKLWGRILVNCLVGFLVGNVLLSLLFSGTHAEQGDRREMLSMPIQQLARCMLYHGGVGILAEDDGTMDDTDKALINDFILDGYYRDYQPDISDPVKKHTNTYVVRYRYREFFRTYLHLLLQYPGDFINAGLALDAGFLSPGDVSHAYVNMKEGTPNLGYVQTHWQEEVLNNWGIYRDTKWEGLHQVLEQWSGENAYLDLPVLKYFFVPGSFLWFYLLLFAALLISRKGRLCMPLSFVAGYYLTMLLGPTVQMRYMYPVMLALPFLALLCLTGEKPKN